MSCSYLAFREPAQGVVQSGTEYKLNSRGTELKVETWHVVPDGSRPIDTDIYVRSGRGTGFPGTWRKVRSREAPTTWRISVHEGRMTLATTDGLVNTSFSLNEANTPQGVYVSLGPDRGNRYTILGPLKFLEQELRQGRVVAQGTGTLSPNGQTMTEDHTDSGLEANPIHIVYDRISPSASALH